MSSPSWASVPGPRAGSNPPSSTSRSRRKAMFRPAPRSPTLKGKSGWSAGGSRRSKTRVSKSRARAPKPSTHRCAGVSRAPGSVMPEVAPTLAPRANGPTRVASQSRSTSTSSSAKTTISPLASSSPRLRAFESPGSGSRTDADRDVAVELGLRRSPRRRRPPRRCRPRSPRGARPGTGSSGSSAAVVRTESGRLRVQMTTETEGASRRSSSRAAAHGGGSGLAIPPAVTSLVR